MTLTDKGNGLRKELRQVLAPVIGDWDLLILVRAVGFKDIWEVGRYVQDVGYVETSKGFGA